MGWIQIPISFDILMKSPTVQAFQNGLLRVMVAVENGRWHLSISCTDRYPTWDEIKKARYDLVPDEIYMVQMLPPKKDYIDIHPNCFHLWEIDPAEGKAIAES